MATLLDFVPFLLTVGIFWLVYTQLAIGLNIHYGYTGLINFGHVAFFAAGAYTAAILTIPPPATITQTSVEYTIGLGIPMPIGFVVSLIGGSIAGGILAFTIGLTSVRLGSHYLAVATFALAMLFQEIIRNEQWLTRGTFGINNVPQPMSQLDPETWLLAYFVIVAVVTVGVYLVAGRLVESPFGRVLKGVREDERAARMLGKRTNRLKLKSFTLGGMIAGLAGALYAHFVGSVIPGQFTVLVTVFVWMAMILGGTASNRGMVAGAFLLILFRESTRFLPDVPGYPLLVSNLRWVVIGLLFILVIRLRPQGLLGRPGEIVVIQDESGDDQ